MTCVTSCRNYFLSTERHPSTLSLCRRKLKHLLMEAINDPQAGTTTGERKKKKKNLEHKLTSEESKHRVDGGKLLSVTFCKVSVTFSLLFIVTQRQETAVSVSLWGIKCRTTSFWCSWCSMTRMNTPRWEEQLSNSASGDVNVTVV